ncbi:DUF7518 family protein [Methanohalophilus portucalensis]|uniref:Uncharacterized protein n=2 Tax=Methanohalophilus portucalensis TaxID=39664 RepID=A0A1L9C3X0_9EURY|nr:hypothetical protein [Methanohalophilus portucalensis]ATU07435.1 hypothetical protein BKM01_00750 [Methanohalophilus portucalensis]OJH49108.1 hypothetical protein MPF_1610 [Methanohalophilus portucalensis FDF-1]RNI08091.1 hypothetical protein EFE41_10595 [Methanohalophilus portucalensis FDF-1]SMH39281.1 hypothetical protein SAMN06264941_1368 [Methanohalophilus portucalensis FDF-1]
MESGQRDLIIERLEKQIRNKEEEISDIKTNLKSSIITELREELRNDMDINKRLVELEQQVKEISTNINGILEELLDQKSRIREMEQANKQQPGERESDAWSKYEEETASPDAYNEEKEPVTQPAETSNDTPERSRSSPEQKRKPRMHFQIRDVDKMMPSEKNQENEVSEEEKDEYIVAESENRKVEKTIKPETQNENCEYIIAGDKGPLENKSECEYETVENKDEDSEIIVRKKKSF